MSNMDRTIRHPYSGLLCTVLHSDFVTMFRKRRLVWGDGYISLSRARVEAKCFAESEAVRRMTPVWNNGRLYLNGQEIFQ